MVFIAVDLEAVGHFTNLAIDPGMEEPFLAYLFEELAVMPFTPSDHRSQDIGSLSAEIIENQIDNLIVGIFDHLLAGVVRIGFAGTGKQQAQEVVNLGYGAYGRSGVFIGGLLFDGDNRA